jgi:hypothetical protein
MAIGVPKVPFRLHSLEKKMMFGLTYSATCQISPVIWKLSIIFSDLDVFISPKIDWIINISEREVMI